VKLRFLLSTILSQLIFHSLPAHAQDSPRVGDILPEEVEKVSRRQKPLNLWSIGFGPFWTNNLNVDQTHYGASLGRHWEAAEEGEIRLNGFAAFGGGAQFLGASAGAAWLPIRTQISPILGARFGAGFADSGKDNVSAKAGFLMGAWGGVRLFRLSQAQLEFAFRTDLLLHSNENGKPLLYGVELSVLFP